MEKSKKNKSGENRGRPNKNELMKFDTNDFPNLTGWYDDVIQKEFCRRLVKLGDYKATRDAKKALTNFMKTGYITEKMYLRLCNFESDNKRYYKYHSKSIIEKSTFLRSKMYLDDFCKRMNGKKPSAQDEADFENMMIQFCRERNLIPETIKSGEEKYHDFFEIK